MDKLCKGDIISFSQAKMIDKRTKFVLITNPNPASQAQLVCLDDYKSNIYRKGDILTMTVVNCEGVNLIRRRHHQ